MRLSETFSANVKARLAAFNMTRKELANQTKISRNTINLAASGKSKMIRFDTIEKIAVALKCQPYQLFDCKSNWAIYKWADDYKRKDKDVTER